MITTAAKRTNRKEQESWKEKRKANCQAYTFSQMGYVQDLWTNNLMFMAAFIMVKSRDKSGKRVLQVGQTKQKQRKTPLKD